MNQPGETICGWTLVERLGGGNQGDVWIVREESAREACMKVLRDEKGSKERRTRFAREASLFETLRIDGIPRLLDANVLGAGPSNGDVRYLCTELIRGETLERVGLQPLPRILAAIDRLLGIVHQLHTTGVVHRDIKPQNIIAREGNIEDLWLVDFGLACTSVAIDDYQTETGAELGNRFLRLPELHSGSRAKQDPVSDVTFCVGVLFQLVVGKAPRLLEDAAGRMPHQRPEMIEDRLAAPEFQFLLRIFDKGFRTRVDERFASIQEFRDSLRTRSEVSSMGGGARTMESIVVELNDPGTLKMQLRFNNRNAVIAAVHRLAGEMQGRLGGAYVSSQSGHTLSPKLAETHIGFAMGDDYSVAMRASVKSEVIGSQIVVSADGVEICRADADAPAWGATLEAALRRTLEGTLVALHDLRQASPK